MTRESEILNQCRYYIDLFRAIGSNTYRRDYEEFAVFQTQSRDPYPMVFRIGGSKYYMVSDGHHRLACLYVMGKRYVNVKVIGVKKKNRLRDCQKAENQSAGALKYLTGIGEMMNKIYDRIRTGIAIFKELALVEKIDLEKTYVNSLDHIEVKNVYEIIATRPEKFPDRLLKDSYDVEILQKFKDKINITDDEIKESRCYQTSCQYMCRYGTFNRVNNETDLLKYCRGFIDLYKTFDKAPYIKSPWRYISIFSRILGGNPPVVVKVADSDYCMILGGHHRLSCLYVLGKRFVNSRVEGVIKKPV
ncbi:MAG: hypothetical protein JW847_00380 [Candidatus Omnitrophica bacterium]|nr:hypothetical protein [Candidatus Omnitrophota bacterium]